MNNAYHLKASQINQSFVYLFLLFPNSPPDTMASLVMLRVILAQHDIRKLTSPSGIPVTVEDLHAAVKEAFDIQEEFTLQ